MLPVRARGSGSSVDTSSVALCNDSDIINPLEPSANFSRLLQTMLFLREYDNKAGFNELTVVVMVYNDSCSGSNGSQW